MFTDELPDKLAAFKPGCGAAAQKFNTAVSVAAHIEQLVASGKAVSDSSAEIAGIKYDLERKIEIVLTVLSY